VTSFHSMYMRMPAAPLPARMRSHSVSEINARFRNGRPSDSLLGAGLLVHQWDGQEEGGQGHNSRPWEACLSNCRTQGRVIYGRVSSMIIYQGLRARRDRLAVPLPFGDRGGLLINPEHALLDCLYGIDGATYLLNDPAKPGCSASFCDPQHPWSNNQLCGLSGAPATAWHPSDLRQLLMLHAEHGARWHEPGWHSGCKCWLQRWLHRWLQKA